MKAFFLLLLFPALLLSAQKHDYVWTLGYSIMTTTSQGTNFGGVLMDFKQEPPALSWVGYVINRPRAAISDAEGQLVAYTDGCRVLNRHHQIMANGDSISPGVVFNNYCGLIAANPPFWGDYPVWQGDIFLPFPGSDSLYALFHLKGDDDIAYERYILYSTLDASAAGGDGAVTEKNRLLADDPDLSSYTAATRHANGRDWWVAVPRRSGNEEVHLVLLTPQGAEYRGMMETGSPGGLTGHCCGQTCFSPDGSKYLRNYPGGLLVLDFDRCAGTFSNPRYLDYSVVPIGAGGVAVSPNSRFAYLGAGGAVHQYDLLAPDLAASLEVVATYDGGVSPLPTTFFQAMLAPDGRIYLICSYTNNILHRIERPNEQGEACGVSQRAVTLPALTGYVLVNFAHYRLGPLDGSPCDTLGIDNLPLAHFRWDIEDSSAAPLALTFTDLSAYAPTSWHWDFGDGGVSQDTSPVHAYAAPGVYEVCLAVCNPNACDTLCREVRVGLVGTQPPPQQAPPGIKIWPNPATGEVEIALPSGEGWGSVRVHTATGTLVRAFEGVTDREVLTFEVGDWPAGVYFVSAVDRERGVVAARLVVQRE
jgi:hypothetical protein